MPDSYGRRGRMRFFFSLLYATLAMSCCDANELRCVELFWRVDFGEEMQLI